MCRGLQCHSCSTQLPPQVHFLISLYLTWLNGFWVLYVLGGEKKKTRLNYRPHLKPSVSSTYTRRADDSTESNRGWLTLNDSSFFLYIQTGSRGTITSSRPEISGRRQLRFAIKINSLAYGYKIKQVNHALGSRFVTKGGRQLALVQPSFSLLPTSEKKKRNQLENTRKITSTSFKHINGADVVDKT